MRAMLSLAAVAVALAAATGAAAAPRLGDTPAFSGPGLDGRAVDLSALRGKAVVVDLWATWCPPCRAELPVLDTLAQARAAEGVVVLALSADRARDRADARRVVAHDRFAAAMLEDAKVNDFGVPKMLPTTYVLDRRGRVTAIFGVGGVPFDAGALDRAVAAAER